MTTPKKHANPRALAMYRKEIEAAHEALNLADMPERSGVMLAERCASVVREMSKTRAHSTMLALKVAEFVGEIVTIFNLVPPDGDAVRNSDLLLAELRKARDSARADRHNLNSAAETIATVTRERDTAMSANLALRCERDAAVKAMGKPDARDDSAATIAALAALCEHLGPDDGQTAKHYVELAREAARAARGLS
jgi:hypothetical protein